ncbi:MULTISPECIES: DNA mismatch repair endonuclease MutL [unclassified Paenibacillus]|uniref:DNA mismatch repair endonuclease MutL n=1 Tax=unclassified Paenibacillus TaxID=185978 RepID=UPI002405CF4F|nr:MULTISPECIES: DNA mismatch repair endonuclease MutL [unclassified Paenibacillus]MDF9841039.1 DNA mismatch repair protein MutL [Paenibacillus sp. PastF-2]MDF9847788.1 DNA mismatch repair protein MutL [Paenibacillus sp. PastM-2]MDF9854357.1 DNA mismatch repair protein MutL [Paenibacillus sp. PastF-1]MDH6479472.1 DNA mismatch repair protein MutL [Paenibacillus sp. PastH-2]MDH6505138.1 DNA mismatch repair protein MutL [Paenibacillus sp. PastM-3]
MAKIHVLDEHIANQIAAGEVVERPASVVKELVENAIDAGSTRIEVTVEEGGLQSIRVKDNGSGIEAEDCETAFYRHATSKIASGRDLFQITSLGFRGEALPSIAAVSKVTLLTASGDDGKGRQLAIEGGRLIANEDQPAGKGSDMAVRELFYNTPARLKYMKSIQTELGHISDAMYRMALAHPDISFTLHHNGNQLLHTLGNGDLLQVIAAVYGTSAAKAMLPVSAEDPDYKITGYISRPEWTRSNRNAVTTIVGGRYIRSNGLNAAILRAYHTLLPINRYPLLVLKLDMHPSLVDVNVHPAKLEVRFSKETELYAFVEQELRKVLLGQSLIPRPGRETVGGQGSSSFIQEQFAFSKGAAPAAQVESAAAAQLSAAAPPPGLSGGSYAPPAAPGSEGGAPPVSGGLALTDGPSGGAEGRPPVAGGSADPLAARPGQLQPPAYQPQARESAAVYSGSFPQAPERTRSDGGGSYRQPPAPARGSLPGAGELYAPSGNADPGLPQFPELNYIGQHHGTYIIAQNDSGLYLIDQHAAHERINYEYYYEKFGRPEDASQELLLPITLEFTPSESRQLSERLHWFEKAGVYLEHFGGQTFLVRSLPYWFPEGEEKALVEEMAEWVLSERSIDLAKLREKSSILCSCKASIKANQKLTEPEVDALLSRLAACKQPYTCPHGRPIVVSFSAYDLEKLFKRVM